MMRWHRVKSALLALALTGPAALAETSPCRQALVLALDVSGSVDAREYRLQLDGIATALGDPKVRRALLSSPQAPVEMMVFEWSGPGDHHLLVPWSAIRAPADIAVFQEVLRQSQRRDASPGTAIGAALEAAGAYLQDRAQCWRRTIDISGDGKSNLGPEPRLARDRLNARGITVNALVIGADNPNLGDLRQAEIGELSSYFRTRVITPGEGFVETSLGYDGYAQAMARKLERELREPEISGLGWIGLALAAPK